MRNILLVGITGSGKSSAGNLLCRPDSEQFSTSDGVRSHTKDGKSVVSMANNIKVTDTMGFLDTDDSAAMTKLKITNALAEIKEGVHCIMFFAKFGRFTKVEYMAMELMVETIFGHECKPHLCFVLTHVSPSKMATNTTTQQNWLRDQLNQDNSTDFAKMYQLCGGRLVFVSNPPYDDDPDAERLNEKQRLASRDNLFRVINSMDERRAYLPEVARRVQAEYEAKLNEMKKEAAEAATRREREIKEAALAEFMATAEGKKLELMTKQIDAQLASREKEITELLLIFLMEMQRNQKPCNFL